MQTLGISDAPVRSESRIKSIFWPEISSAYDVDYIGTQGFWICTAGAVLTFLFLLAQGSAWTAIAGFLFLFVGGVGVREHDRYSALAVFLLYLLNIVLSLNVFQLFICAVFLSNVRGTWLAANWKPGSEEAECPPRMSETFFDKLSDQLPAFLWPKIRILYYVF